MTGSTNTWLIFAFISMIMFSVSNVLLKQTINNSSISKLSIQAIIGIVITVLVTAAIIYLLFLRTILPVQSLPMIFGILILSFLAVGFEIFALKQGEVALVNAILGLSTIGIAIISYFFLGDRFTEYEILAIILATISVFLLII